MRENVGFGDLAKMQDEDAITEAIAKAGLAGVIQNLDHGLETLLGKQLEGGIDLSGGQEEHTCQLRARANRIRGYTNKVHLRGLIQNQGFLD
ncbi:MAG: hypothetical protein ACYTXA_18885 [Nostoc sp.]